MDYKRTNEYLPRVHHTKQMDEELRESYRILEKRLFHEGRIVTPSFIAENNMLPFFQAIGFEPFLTLNEPICPRFVVEFYHSLEVKRNELDIPYIEFKLGESMHCIHALLPNHWKKVQLHFDDYLSNGGSHKEMQRFTFHEHVMDPLDISRNPSTEKGKKIASPLVISSLSSSSDDNEAPSFLEFYDELSESEDLTKHNERREECLNA
ncbi:hypothetical protein Tco_1043976 [Tanacetum coccineum]|uniref:Uncharacterized protein n=1 Tax=Tanacetum coccineum TaxID=301880 RepID=A0ABQ5GNL8_9ASTR